MRRAAEKSSRSLDDIRLVAVTKMVSVDQILEAVRGGVKDVAENRVQEAQSKRIALSSLALQHHLIGELQRNKTRKAVEIFDLIHSIDSPRLAETLDRVAGDFGKTQDCLIEVKISTEPTKAGVSLAESPKFISEFKRFKHLRLKGLMTIAPLGISEVETRQLFRQFHRLFLDHQSQFGEHPVLSMGMSDDFEMAVEEGSTMVRIGRAIFGERLS